MALFGVQVLLNQSIQFFRLEAFCQMPNPTGESSVLGLL
jgi:hypothetical protein